MISGRGMRTRRLRNYEWKGSEYWVIKTNTKVGSVFWVKQASDERSRASEPL
jgi:hypothetical protein